MPTTIYKILVQDFASDHKWKLITYIILVFAFFPIESIFLPKIYGQLFEKISSISQFNGIYNLKDNISKMNFAGTITILIMLWGLVILSYCAKNYVESLLIPNYFSYLRDIIFKSTIKSHLHDFKDVKTGDYLARVLELTRNFKDLFQHLLSRFIPELIVTLLIVGYMFYQNKTIGTILFIGTALCGIIQYFGTNKLIDLIIDRETFFNTKVSENLRDSLDNLMNIFLNNEVDTELKKNSDIETIATNKLKHIMFIQNVVVLLTQIVVLITFALSILFLYYLISKGQMKATHSVVLIIILGQYLTNFLYVNSGFVHNIVYKLGIINTSTEYLNNIFESVDSDKKRQVHSGINDGYINFKNVSFKYSKDSNEWLFENYNLELESKGKYAIMGQSGRGKTTLMKMLVALYKPTKGTIYIDDVDIKNVDLTYLRDNVNYVNQRTNMFNESIVYNMLYGNPDNTKEDVIKLLNKYELATIFDELPDGLDSMAGIHGGNLSGGMQRVIILVRGIMKTCKVLILDEPTTGLDKNSIEKVKKLIVNETNDKTLLIVTHEPSFAMLSGVTKIEIK